MKRSPYINTFENSSEFEDYISYGNVEYPNIAFISYTGDITLISHEPLPEPTISYISFNVFNEIHDNDDLGEFSGYDYDIIAISGFNAEDGNSTFDSDAKSYAAPVVKDSLGNDITQYCTFSSSYYSKEYYEFEPEEELDPTYNWEIMTSILPGENETPYSGNIVASYTFNGTTFTDTITFEYSLTSNGENPGDDPDPYEDMPTLYFSAADIGEQNEYSSGTTFNDEGTEILYTIDANNGLCIRNERTSGNSLAYYVTNDIATLRVYSNSTGNIVFEFDTPVYKIVFNCADNYVGANSGAGVMSAHGTITIDSVNNKVIWECDDFEPQRTVNIWNYDATHGTQMRIESMELFGYFDIPEEQEEE